MTNAQPANGQTTPNHPPAKPLPPPSDVPHVVIERGIGGGTTEKRAG